MKDDRALSLGTNVSGLFVSSCRSFVGGVEDVLVPVDDYAQALSVSLTSAIAVASSVNFGGVATVKQILSIPRQSLLEFEQSDICARILENVCV